MSAAPRLSVVIPVYNEEAVLPLLVERLTRVLDTLAGDPEVLFVNDGSRDRSLEILAAAAARDGRLKVLDLSRNFGHPAAITAGLDHATGDAVVVMDADLQDPPELIPELLARHAEGFDVVHARRSARHAESLFKRLSADLFYRLMRVTADHPPEPAVGEFRLMSAAVVSTLREARERHRLVRGLVAWAGFRQAIVDFERPGRAAGETKFPFRRMFRLSWDAITSFSVAPLRLASWLGALCLALGLAVALRLGWLAWRGATSAFLLLLLAQLVLSGLVLVCLGLVGEYLGRIFEEVKARPLYVVRERIGAVAAPAPDRDALTPP